jgi:EmrB/QacA subfamily drug resistance transporter
MNRVFLVPLIVACALFMENLDSTVLATSLPAIARSLDVNPLTLNLAITSYLLSLAVFIPISGWVADRFGARRVFRLAIAVFMLGSICCGLSQSLWQLVAARILQGAGGAMMIPVGRLVILRSVPKNQLVNALAYLTVPALLGPIIGPPLGGFITTYFDWRWIFWINLPIGIVGIWLATRYIPDLKEDGVPRLDSLGFLFSALALAGTVFGFEALGRNLLPDWMVATLLGGGALSGALYLLHARRVAAPLLDLGLFRLPTFRAAVLGGLFFRLGIGALPFLLPLMLQFGFGYTALESGLTTFVAAIGAITMKIAAAPILRRLGFKFVLITNALVSAIFLAAIGLFMPTTPHVLMLAVLLMGGFFRSLQFTSLNAITYAQVDRPRMSAATSLSAMMQQLSLSIGVGVGALTLHYTLAATDRSLPAAGDFALVFGVVGASGALSALAFLRLPHDAGSEVSGRIKLREGVAANAGTVKDAAAE